MRISVLALSGGASLRRNKSALKRTAMGSRTDGEEARPTRLLYVRSTPRCGPALAPPANFRLSAKFGHRVRKPLCIIFADVSRLPVSRTHSRVALDGPKVGWGRALPIRFPPTVF